MKTMMGRGATAQRRRKERGARNGQKGKEEMSRGRCYVAWEENIRCVALAECCVVSTNSQTVWNPCILHVLQLFKACNCSLVCRSDRGPPPLSEYVINVVSGEVYLDCY